MTDKPSISGERSSDLAVLAADTLLLDALGQGEPATADDEVASLLAAWRADLATAESDPAAADLEVARLVTAAADPAGRGRAHRVARWVSGAAAAVLLAAGGLVVGAGHATPGNPLWPITRVMYPEHADKVAAEHSLASARRAAAEGRVDDARRLLAQAEILIARLSDPGRAQRLRADLKSVQGMLPATAPHTPAPVTPATPTPARTGPAGGPAATPTAGGPAPLPTGAVPEPKATAGGAPALPPVVPVPPTTLSVPPPGVTLPPVLPGVGLAPLPAGGGLLPGLS